MRRPLLHVRGVAALARARDRGGERHSESLGRRDLRDLRRLGRRPAGVADRLERTAPTTGASGREGAERLAHPRAGEVLQELRGGLSPQPRRARRNERGAGMRYTIRGVRAAVARAATPTATSASSSSRPETGGNTVKERRPCEAAASAASRRVLRSPAGIDLRERGLADRVVRVSRRRAGSAGAAPRPPQRRAPRRPRRPRTPAGSHR